MDWRHNPHTMNHKLLKAVSTGDADLLAQLLGVWPEPTVAEEGDDTRAALLEGVTAEGSSALHIAASRGYLELVVMICTQNISLVRARNNLLDTPLICTARAGHIHVVGYIIRRALEAGAGYPQRQSVLEEEALAAPVNPVLKAWNSSGATAIHEAIRNGHAPVLEKLMSCDTRLAAEVDGRGVSPLYMAVVSNRVDMVGILIRESRGGVKSPASYAGPDGRTALHAAVYAKNAEEMIESLQRWEPRLAEKADSTGRTALHHAASAGKTRVVKLLLSNSSFLAYIQDGDGLFPLHSAAISGYSKVMREIMTICPSCDELLVDKKQRNILHYAVEHGRVMLVWHICRNPKFATMMNAGDGDGNTPLHLAIKHGRWFIFCYLMMHTSVNLTIMNNAGLTPHDFAKYKYFSDYTYLLLIINFSMKNSLLLCGAPLCFEARNLVDKPLLEDKRKESSNYTDVSQSLLYISVFIAAGSFAAAFTVPGGYKAEGEDAGMPVFAGTVDLENFVIGNSFSFYFSTIATCLLVHGSLKTKYTGDPRNFLAASALLVWAAALGMLYTFTTVVGLTSNFLEADGFFYFTDLFNVVVFLGFCPTLLVASPILLWVARQLRMRRLFSQSMCEAFGASITATFCGLVVIGVVESSFQEVGLSPVEELRKFLQSGSWNCRLFKSQGDQIFLHPT